MISSCSIHHFYHNHRRHRILLKRNKPTYVGAARFHSTILCPQSDEMGRLSVFLVPTGALACAKSSRPRRIWWFAFRAPRKNNCVYPCACRGNGESRCLLPCQFWAADQNGQSLEKERMAPQMAKLPTSNRRSERWSVTNLGQGLNVYYQKPCEWMWEML